MAKKIDYKSMYTLRADGRYMGYWHDMEGKRHPVYDRDAEALYWKIDELEKPKVPTFKDIAEAWHVASWDNYRAGTKACYTSMYNRAIGRHGEYSASELMAADITNHLQMLSDQKLSRKSIKTLLTLYKLIYLFAINDNRFKKNVTVNPALNVKLPDNMKPAAKREAPDDEVIEKIRINAETACFGLFALVLMGTGHRRGECLALNWADIDAKKKTIDCTKTVIYRNGKATIGPTKTRSAVRTVPLFPDVEKALIRPAGAKDTDYIFCGEDPTKPMPEATFRRRWKRYCVDMGFIEIEEQAKIDEHGKKSTHIIYHNALTPHVLRHGYATMLFDAGVDVYTAQKLLGHANVETTIAIYTHLSKRKKQESIDKLTAYAANGYKPVLSIGLSTNLQALESA